MLQYILFIYVKRKKLFLNLINNGSVCVNKQFKNTLSTNVL